MRIYKRPQHLVFDTQKPNEIIYGKMDLDGLVPLQEAVFPATIMEFAENRFQATERIYSHVATPKHPFFDDFGNSYYHQIIEKTKVTREF